MSAHILRDRKVCAFGEHLIPNGGHYYVVNPEGGYERAEWLCCQECIDKPEWKHIKDRMSGADGTIIWKE